MKLEHQKKILEQLKKGVWRSKQTGVSTYSEPVKMASVSVQPIEGCGCGEHQQKPPHPCPFKEEIHGDEDALCTCCEDCAHECAMDI